MKKSIILSLIIGLCFTAKTSKAIDPTYSLTIKNVSYKSNSVLEFDIYLKHTNPSEADFNFVTAQYFVTFNSAILNGGIGKFEIASSQLQSSLLPVNPSIEIIGTDAVLRMAAHSASTSAVISSTGDGSLVVKGRLTNTTGAFNLNQNPNLQWKNDGLFVTKVAANVSDISKIVTESANHFVEAYAVQTSLNEITKNGVNPIALFPSPATSVLNYSIDLQKGETIQTVSVVNMLGESVMQINESTMNQNQITLNNNVTTGNYLFEIRTDKGLFTKRFSVIK